MKYDELSTLQECIHQHIHKVWVHRAFDFFSWELGSITKTMPEFKVARIKPLTDTQAWVYLSVGLSTKIQDNGCGLELFLLSPCEEALHVELLAMIANYSCDEKVAKLGLHSIINIGRPWLEGSSCDHLLISLPYTLGPKVEWPICELKHKLRVLWLLPITASEADFARLNGVEALEQMFDIAKINPLDRVRTSVA